MTSGYEYTCSAAPYTFDAQFLIGTDYESSGCSDLAQFTGFRADYCISFSSSYSSKYTSSNKNFATWSNGDCSGTPDSSQKYPIGDCLSYSRRLAYATITNPEVATTQYDVGNSVSGSGEVTGGDESSGNDDDDDAACFVEDSMVQLKDGSSIPIQSVKVGDEILSLTYGGELVYSPVIAFPHALDNDLRAKVITVDTEESSVTLSRDHLLPVCSEDDCSACGTGSSSLSPLSLVPSQDIKPNMCLRTAAASDSAWAKVTSVSSHSAPAKGMYTVVTLAAYPVVDGIVASPFGTSHVLPSIYYTLHATCYRLGLLGVPAVKMGLDLMNQQMTAILSQRSVREALLSFSSKEHFSL
jgi:hypothetical protein